MKKLISIFICILIFVSLSGCERVIEEEKQMISNSEDRTEYKKLEGEELMKKISKINIQQSNSIIDLSNKVLLYGTYHAISINEIYKLAPFNQIRYSFTEENQDYYYTIYYIDDGYLITFFNGEKGCSIYNLNLNLAIVTHKLFSAEDFEKLKVNKSTFNDVLKIDELSKIKNTDYFISISEKCYYKYSIHMTSSGVILIGYNDKKIPVIKSITEIYNKLISNINENDKKLII